jgi:hypothetical protein
MKGCRNLPAEMRVDYVRLYQDPDDPTHTLGCSPPSHPTAGFIATHAERYQDWIPGDAEVTPLSVIALPTVSVHLCRNLGK